MTGQISRLLPVISTLVRLGLATVWLVAGALKVGEWNHNYVAVAAYQVLPASWVGPVSLAQPFLELALGTLLLAGVGIRLVAGLSGLVLVVFIAAIVQAWARGLTIDCGCFSAGGTVAAGQTHYLREIARDLGFGVMSVWLVARPQTVAALDGTVQPATANT